MNTDFTLLKAIKGIVSLEGNDHLSTTVWIKFSEKKLK